MKVWCIQDRTGVWCATADGAEPENDLNVKTRCGDYITMPHGISLRKPTCRRCATIHPAEAKEGQAAPGAGT